MKAKRILLLKQHHGVVMENCEAARVTEQSFSRSFPPAEARPAFLPSFNRDVLSYYYTPLTPHPPVPWHSAGLRAQALRMLDLNPCSAGHPGEVT